jgi:hypothetical protein
MTEFSEWLVKYIAHGLDLVRKRNFDSPKGIIEYCQSLREFWIPSDSNGDRLASIVLGSHINKMCDAIRLAGGTPPVTSQSISSVDEGMRAVDLIVKWCKSQETDDIEWSKAHSPTHWRKVYAVDGVSISQDTFRRMKKAGEICVHPDSTTKTIRIDKRNFPPGYTED